MSRATSLATRTSASPRNLPASAASSRRASAARSGLAAATESPHVPPEARDRIQRFVELHRSAAADLDKVAPDVFVGRLIQRLGTRFKVTMVPSRDSLRFDPRGLSLDNLGSTSTVIRFTGSVGSNVDSTVINPLGKVVH